MYLFIGINYITFCQAFRSFIKHSVISTCLSRVDDGLFCDDASLENYLNRHMIDIIPPCLFNKH